MKQILLPSNFGGRNNWLGGWLLGLLLGLCAPRLVYGQATSPFVVRVTPAGPLNLVAGARQTLTAAALYPTLTVGTGFDNTVTALSLQPDGKLVVGGDFTSYNGQPAAHLVRLNADGTRDASFAVGTGLDGPVNALLVQPDGDVVVGGAFSSYNGASRSNLVRLLPDGGLDASFRQAGAGLNGAVQALALQPDGQLVVGGAFTAYNGQPQGGLLRFNTIGNLDISFRPSLAFSVSLLARQTDGKLVVGNSSNLARVLYNGSLDPSFSNGLAISSRFLAIRYTSLTLQPDNRAIVGGYTIQYPANENYSFVARLSLTGNSEFRYDDSNLTTQGVSALAVQADGRLLAGLTSFGSAASGGSGYVNNYLLRLTAAGTLEARLGSAANFNAPTPVAAIAVQPNGQLLIGGSFTDYNGTAQNRIARLNADGTLNTTETPVAGATYTWSTGATGPSIVVSQAGTYSVTATVNGQLATSNAVTVNVLPAATTPLVVRVTPAGPLTLAAGTSQTLTASTTYPGFSVGTGFDNTVNALAVQPDGKILVGGSFGSYNATGSNDATAKGLARLNADGSLDSPFVRAHSSAGQGFDGTVNALVLQPDGKIVVGGSFTHYEGAARANLARLNANGSLDASFAPAGTGLDGAVTALLLQADGQLVVGGSFTSYNGTARPYLARLTASGALDNSFVPSLAGPVAALAQQKDGKILVGGNYLVRLTPDGSLDTGYANIAGSSGGIHPTATYVTSIALQPDDKAVLGGYFSYIAGGLQPFVERLNLAGAVEFSSTIGNSLLGTTAVAVEADGRILVGVNTFSGTGAITYFLRLTAAGGLDAALGTSSVIGDAGHVNAIAVQPNGQILIGGTFTNYNGTAQNRIARLNADGTLNTTETPVAGATYTWSTGATGPSIVVSQAGTYSVTATVNGQSATSNAVAIAVVPANPFVVRVTPAGPLNLVAGASQTLTATAVYPALAVGTGFNGNVTALAVQPDGKLVVGGDFTNYNGQPAAHLVRLNADGTRDASFAVGTGLDGPVNALLVQPDGDVVVGGAFSSYNGASRSNLVRLLPDGGLDASFRQAGAGLNGAVQALALQPDGQLLAGGKFTSYNGMAYAYLLRFTTIGNLDASFGSNLPSPVLALARQPDGNILVGGNYLVRLFYNGAQDPSYAGILGYSGSIHTVYTFVTSLALQPDGKAVVGGYSYAGGLNVGLVQRYTQNGSVDFTFGFNTFTSQQGPVTVAVQNDGRILLSTITFSSVGKGTYLYRLTAAGTLDAALGGSSVIGDLAPGLAIVVQPNGQILLGGAFTNYNGAIVNHLVRLNADGTLNTTDTPVAGATYTWNTGATGPSIVVTKAGAYSATAMANGQSAVSNVVIINAAGASQKAVAYEAAAELATPLEGNPNPCTDYVQLRFALARTEAYTLAVYDMQGRLVAELAGGTADAGQLQQVPWPASNYAAGLYLVRLRTATTQQQLKLVRR